MYQIFEKKRKNDISVIILLRIPKFGEGSNYISNKQSTIDALTDAHLKCRRVFNPLAYSKKFISF